MKKEAIHADAIKTAQGVDAGVLFIILTQFGLAFSINIVLSFLPFYILRISSFSPARTMVWIGLIMGMNSFVMAAAAPFWGSMLSRWRPKGLYERVFLISGIVFLAMGFTESLPALLALRIIQGALGGSSTIGLFMVSRLSSPGKLAGNLSLYQNSITAGQLLAPPVGAFLVVKMGYAAPFVISSLLMGASLFLCHRYVVEVNPADAGAETKTELNRQVLWGWALSFIATINLTFLPAILPHVLEGFALQGEGAIKAAGTIMMGYTGTALLGNYAFNRLTPAEKTTGAIVLTCLAAALFQMLMYFAPGIVSFAVLRMLQTGMIAAVISLVMSGFASKMGGTGIGFLNSARFAGNGAGPMLATFVLARANLFALYLVIALATLGSALAYRAAKRETAPN